MAPPRRGAVADDSRSEASNGAREPKGKGRRAGNGPAASREAKGSTTAGPSRGPTSHAQHAEDPQKVCSLSYEKINQLDRYYP